MKNYEKLNDIKPNNNEYVFLKNTIHSKPKELLYTDGNFIDFEMHRFDADKNAFWRPVHSINPITKDLCKIILDTDELPEESTLDGYASNEYFSTFLNKGRRYMLVHEGRKITTRRTEELDD